MRLLILHFFLITSILSNAQIQSQNEFIDEAFVQATSLADSGRTDSAIALYNQGILEASSYMDSIELTQMLIDKGKAYERTGHYTLSTVSYLKAINLAQNTRQQKVIGISHLGLSNINFRIANGEKALSHSIEASNVFSEIKDTTNYITASMLMGQVYISMEKYDEALSIYTDMLKLAKNISDSILLADNLDHIGVIYGFQKEFDKALPYHLQAMEINKEIENDFNLSINYANIGEVYLRKKQYSQSLLYLNRGLEMASEINFRSLMIFIHYTLGQACSEMAQNQLALSHFDQSIRLIKELGEHRELPAVYSLIADHYERNNNHTKALSYYKKFSNTRDSLNSLSKNLQMEELKTLYEMDKKEQELKSVLLEKKLQERELKTSKGTIKLQYLILTLIILGLISSIIFTITFYRNQKNLKQANNTKDVLFSIIGHDLRGPVGNIKKLTELAQKSDEREKSKILGLLRQPAEASFNLLNDLLEWSRSINNQLDYKPDNIQVNSIISKALDLFEREVNFKNISVENQIPDEVFVFVDRNHFYTILRNLLSNAIKFTPTGGKIILDSNSESTSVKIMVTDTGVGIEKQNIKKLLDKDSIFTTYGTNEEKGSGLGLLLCKEFIKINNGQFGVESQVGKGSTFYFILPKG